MLYFIERMNMSGIDTPERKAAVYGLAVVGFIALMGAGIWLAFYSTRFVPDVANRIGSAAVFLGSLFTPAPTLTVVPTPTASTTISFGPTSTSPTATTSASASGSTQPKTTSTSAGTKTGGTYVLGSGGIPAAFYGLPDLVVSIDAVGYLTSTSTDSFVAGSVVSANNRPAVKFTVRNIGTNATGLWRFSASIPTVGFYVYRSLPQQSLNPGDSIEYTLGFDQANRGPNQMISITANFERTVTESTMNNNSASAQVTVLAQ